MKMLDKIMLSFYYIIIISITLLVVLGSLYFIDLIFEELSQDYKWLGIIVTYTYCVVVLLTLIMIIFINIFKKVKICLYKKFGHYDVSIRCLKEGNEFSFYICWGKTSKWIKNNIEEIEVAISDRLNSPEEIITLSKKNKWEEKITPPMNYGHDIDYRFTIRHFQ